MHAIGLGWGLPASDGWDNDGVAPRDFLAGLVATYSPGSFFTYPPVHLLILAALTLPITAVALARAPSFGQADVIHEIVKVPYMTSIACVSRVVAVAMSLGIVYAAAKIGEELRGRRAGWCVSAVCGLNVPFTYYAHTSNLDVPYLFWALFALLALTRAIARREPARLRRVVVLAVLAVGTKDQAYGMFLLGVPSALVAWAALDPWARRHLKMLAKELGTALVHGVGLFLVADAVILNPTGFRARVRFLVGPASQDFVHYTRDTLGRLLAFRDSFLELDRFYPAVFALLMAAGLALHIVNKDDGAKKAAGLVPLFALLSFTLLFNCTALRTEHRFLLPQMILWSVYGGLGLERAIFGIVARPARILAHAALSVAFAVAIFRALTVDANLVLDPRYDAEAWLASHVSPGDEIEVYGLNVYLPRFPAQARVLRVGPEEKRNPLAGVTEIVAPFGKADERRARWIVVSEGWVWRYLPDPTIYTPGYVNPPTQLATETDPDGAGFFPALLRGERGYTRAHAARWDSTLWPRLDMHASLSREIWIFERRPGT